MTDEEKAERRRVLGRERCRRYRERHPDRVRAQTSERARKYRERNPEAVKAAHKRHSERQRQELNADLYGAISARSELFFNRVTQAELGHCWPWQGWQAKAGYGGFSLGSGRWIAASRAALMFKLGRNIGQGMFACHTCDNPACCNPAHLYEGTPQQNALDRGARGRQTPRRGEKINEEQARCIFEEPGSHSAVGRKYGVSRTMVSNIKTGKSWKRIHSGTITHA